MVTPYVSILIPAWNGQHTLARAIRSAQQQAGVDVEIIVCDNGSSDQTFDVAKRFDVESFRFDMNLGFTGAMNALTERAQGLYCICLGVDDWFEPDSLVHLARALDATPQADFAYGAQKFWGRRSDIYVPPPYNEAQFYVHNPANVSFMFRRRVWLDGLRWGGEIERCVGTPDWDFNLQIIEHGGLGVAVPNVIVLNWTFAHGSNTDKTWLREGDVLDEMKRRHPRIDAARI